MSIYQIIHKLLINFRINYHFFTNSSGPILPTLSLPFLPSPEPHRCALLVSGLLITGHWLPRRPPRQWGVGFVPCSLGLCPAMAEATPAASYALAGRCKKIGGWES